MNIIPVESKFRAMGARFKMSLTNAPDYAIDIRRDNEGEFFELRAPRELADQINLTVAQARPRERHLLLFVRRLTGAPRLDRFLCGHDERSWFVAAVPGGASSVPQAKEALKPAPVLHAQAQNRVTARQRNARKNRAFRRQGEWFFIPVRRLDIDRKLILRNEPIRRGGGKPHFVDELYRTGGTAVYVCSRHPNGVVESEYERILSRNADAAQWGWRRMTRNADVYARGMIRHPDHATVTLPDWHRVVMNTENRAPSMRSMAFLD